MAAKVEITPCSMAKYSKVLVLGSRGLVGGAFMRHMESQGYTNVIGSCSKDCDLSDTASTMAPFEKHQPEFVLLAAAKVGGIHANNTYPADFIMVNLKIQNNVIEACFKHKVKKLLFLGSSCIYPKFAPQPMKEEHLLSGKLESTNDAYAIAKISDMIACKSFNRQHGTNYVAAMPTNLYGPGDNFNLQGSHVLPAMIRKFHEAKVAGKPSVELWGTGTARREFLYVEDMAIGLEHLMNKFNAVVDTADEKMFVNLGTGVDVTIKELAHLVKDTVGFTGDIVWNTDMPDGTPQKLMDVSRLTELGWKATTSLEEGVKKSYQWFLDNQDSFRS
eukprot:NODE_3475_length_1213_cov_12.923853_g3297_i0.p1 GENE.NODE_3475_length_1213_cov_12.923853_g3297_i0~~NODE_3475_length_1213_cov_12.923853_g3297_i0.p1  ORF type:complete len:352 (+),score=90.77 NODE_3475_length_1213_cov_12.923853_g3297_i0:61-1056(+)